jgi:HPt (histidine-containing phosphotransfer) domain-containing protein
MSTIASELPILDMTRILEVFADDMTTCRELLELFITDATRQASTVGVSVHAHDYDEVARTAHTLKGAAANVGAMRLAAKARELEVAAKEHDAGHSSQSVSDITDELQMLTEEAERYLA